MPRHESLRPLAASFVVALVVLVTGGTACSSSSPAIPEADRTGSSSGFGGGAMPGASETWADGKRISVDTTIASGTTVTIAPGATITIAPNATITIAGSLTANSATATHAKLTGSAWGGVVVASGGTLSLSGVDILGALGALTVKSGAAKSEYDNGTIDSAMMPFSIEGGAALTTKGAKVTRALGGSSVAGAFTASHLDYDSNGNTGIMTIDPAAALSIEDSTLHGSGPGADFLVSGGAATFHVAYTDITNVHCGFHFDTITAFDISYTNVHDNQWGFMLYGSDSAGTRSVSYSNIDNNAAYAYEAQGTNGPITFNHCHVMGQASAGVTVTNPEPMTVMGTGPRP